MPHGPSAPQKACLAGSGQTQGQAERLWKHSKAGPPPEPSPRQPRRGTDSIHFRGNAPGGGTGGSQGGRLQHRGGPTKGSRHQPLSPPPPGGWLGAPPPGVGPCRLLALLLRPGSLLLIHWLQPCPLGSGKSSSFCLAGVKSSSLGAMENRRMREQDPGLPWD